MIRKTLAGIAFATCLAAAGNVSAQSNTARALMLDAEGGDAGTVTITETASGMLRIMIEMTGLPPGPHGFHIHEKGVCEVADKFESAGGHYAGEHEHGTDVQGGPHPGDFPNVHVGQDGVLKVEFFTEHLTLGEGENPLLDEDGSAVVVHAEPDDYQSQPAGNAGDRIACGVVEQAT